MEQMRGEESRDFHFAIGTSRVTEQARIPFLQHFFDMQPAPRFDARWSGAQRAPVARLGRYSIIGKLRTRGRADLSVGLPEGACRADELVVIRTWATDAPEGLARELPPEVELSSTLRHDNLVRALGVGYEAGRLFIVSEYLEGTTLRRLIRWLSERGQQLPNAALARVLLGIFAAVEHAERSARTPDERAIVQLPVGSDDVFVTYDGDVKLLGFKPGSARVAAAGGQPSVTPAAVDDLLSNQQSPALSAVLARIGSRLPSASVIGLWQIARTLQLWQTEELDSDGRAELAAVMAGVLPDARATRRAQLAKACARVLRDRETSDESGEVLAESPPVSGYRIMRPGGAVRPSVASWLSPELSTSASSTTALARLASSDARAGHGVTVPRRRRGSGGPWLTSAWVPIVLVLMALALALAIFGVRYP
jgi:serine/threonine protein kinase